MYNPHQQHSHYDNHKRMEIEAEMSRFEKEVLSTSNQISTSGLYQSVQQPISQHSNTNVAVHPHFIPPQIQRQLPNQRPTHGTFIPVTVAHSGQGSHHQNAMMVTGQQLLQQPQTSYTVTPMQMPAVVHQIPAGTSATSSGNGKNKSKHGSNKGKKQKKMLRMAGGQVWEDPTLAEWDPNDFRLFCGDLGNDVGDDVLMRTFNRYPSFVKAKVIRDKKTNKSRGYGFVSFKDPQDFSRAMKEMNGKYVGSRPIKLRKSNWNDRNMDVQKKKHKMKQKLGLV